MSKPITAGAISRPFNNHRLLEHPSSLKDLVDKIASLSAVDIKYIAKKISLSATSSLGVVGKAYVAQQSIFAMSKVISKGSATAALEVKGLQSRINIAKTDIEYLNYNHIRLKLLDQYLDYTQTCTLWYAATEDFQKEISASFATPLDFLTKGIRFQISNDEQPVGIVKNIAERAGVNLTESGRNYYVCLELDAILTRQNSELVFALIQEGYGIRFNRSTFTLAELKAEFPG